MYHNNLILHILHVFFRDRSLTNVIHRLVLVGVYLVLKEIIVIDVRMDTIISQIVDHVIVIQQELGQINVMKMVFVNVIILARVFARLKIALISIKIQ